MYILPLAHRLRIFPVLILDQKSSPVHESYVEVYSSSLNPPAPKSAHRSDR